MSGARVVEFDLRGVVKAAKAKFVRGNVGRPIMSAGKSVRPGAVIHLENNISYMTHCNPPTPTARRESP